MNAAILKAISNQIWCCDCVDGMRLLPAEVIPLTVTSPPYDNIRIWPFPWTTFQAVAQELYRVTVPGGIVSWVVQDQHHEWSESGTSFRQALHFMEIGFKLYTTVAVERNGCRPGYRPRYWPPLEYVFVLSKGKPGFFDLIRDRATTTKSRPIKQMTLRKRDGSVRTERKPAIVPAFAARTTIWRYTMGYGHTTTDNEVYEQHPALMSEALAQDLIRSFSKTGDLVFDPMAGLGTTCKMAMLNNRPFLGFEQDHKYCLDARKRLVKYENKTPATA